MKNITYNDIKLFIKDRYYHENLINRFENKSYEKEEEILILKHCNISDSVLEIGSCLGYTSALLSKKCKNVISIEANPELIEGLDKMKEKNNLNNLEFINTYISNTKSEIKFQTYDNIVAGSGDREDLHINNIRGWGHTLKEYKIKCSKLIDIDKNNEINTLVIDCEGGELSFLNDNINLIKNNINKIIIELHQHLMKDNQFNNKCINTLSKAGFVIGENLGNTYYFKK